MENIPDCRRNVILPHSSPNKNGRTECSRYCSYPLRTQVVRLWVGKCPFGRIFFPYIEVRAEKTFRELPKQLVQSSYALGCSRFYTIRKIVLPACKGEIVSGVILGGCYAMGATAPLIFTGAVAYSGLPARLTAPAMALPMHLYLLVAQGATSMDAAYGTAFVMMALILFSSLLATIYARRSQKKWNIS